MGRYGEWSENKIVQYEKAGRGQGAGASYRPWIEVDDLSSRGDSRRVFSPLTNRTHHLLSTIEYDFFVLAEFTPGIIDIREQFPLDREDTLSIAAELGITHPIYPTTNVPTVMTCDFVITREQNGQTRHEAYNCKSNREANDKRSLEKLEIMRRLFEASSVPHHLVFDSMLPATKIRNIKWIRDSELSEGELESHPDYFADHCQRFLCDIARPSRQVSLKTFSETYDTRTRAAPGTGLRVARMLLAKRQLVTDLNQPDLQSLPLAMFKTAPAKQLYAGNY